MARNGNPSRSSTGVLRILRDAFRSRRGMVGACLTGSVVLIAGVGPFVAPHTTTEFTTLPFAPPGGGNGLLGGDALGRDVLSRVLDGGWLLLVLAVIATVLAVTVGAIAAVTAAYRGGIVESLIMRSVDVGLSLPQIVFALLLVSVVGPKLWLIVFAVAFTQAPQVARVLFAGAQDVVERDFVKVARTWGMAPRKVVNREIIPNLLSPLMVEAGIRLSYSIIILSGLAFLGFGRQPPAADWGVMINENRLGLTVNPWGVVVPAFLLAVLAVGTNTFSDAIARTTLGDLGGEELALQSGLGSVTN